MHDSLSHRHGADKERETPEECILRAEATELSRFMVEEGCRTIPVPFEEFPAPKLPMEAR